MRRAARVKLLEGLLREAREEIPQDTMSDVADKIDKALRGAGNEGRA